MEYTNNEKSYKGQAIAGLTLGIIGSSLGLMNSGWGNNGCGCNGGRNGILGGLFGNNNGNNCRAEAYQSHVAALQADTARLYADRYTDYVGSEVYQASVRAAGKITELSSEISKLKGEKYTDYVGMDLYKNIVAFSNAEDAKIAALQKEVTAYVIDLDKRTALNEQAAILNRQYDALARDAGFKLLEQKIDCCCDKVNARIDCLTEKTAMADASILSYVNSNFLFGVTKLPITSICPEPAVATTTA